MAEKRKGRKWSAEVTEKSDALDLREQVFKGTPKEIAKSLKRSAERSHRRKSNRMHQAEPRAAAF